MEYKMTVITSNGKVCSINLLDLDYISSRKVGISYHIGKEMYVHMNNLKDLRRLGFHSFGRSTLVNLNQLERFDSSEGRFYFRSGDSCSIDDKYISMLEMLLQNYKPSPIPWSMTVLNDDREIETISLHSVDYIDLERRVPFYHIFLQKRRHIMTLIDLEESSKLEIANMQLLDSGNYVNVAKITGFNRRKGELYFDNPVTRQSKAASIARIHFNIIPHTINRIVMRK